MNEDVYIVTLTGPYTSTVTICDTAISDHAAQQLRGNGRKVRVFRDRKKYLAFIDELEKERKKNMDYEEMILQRQDSEGDDCKNCLFLQICRDRDFKGLNPCQEESLLYPVYSGGKKRC